MLLIRAPTPLLSVLAAAVLLWPIPGSGQSSWEAFAGEPVLTPGSSMWDVLAVGQPSCFEDEGVFRVFYTGAGADARGRIVSAVSVDGIEWTDAGRPVLDIGEPGAWDGYTIDTPEVVRVQGTFFLYYYGSDSAEAEGACLGLATSTDGIAWQKYGANPVLCPGPPGSWDERWLESPAVVQDERSGAWMMYYAALDAGWRARIGLATSQDGTNWNKHPDNPVLDVGAPDSWEDAWVAVPAVVRRNGRFRMWYSGVSAEDLGDGRADSPRVGEATAQDGVEWRRVAAEAVFPVSQDDVNMAPWAPCVMYDDHRGRAVMLFETAEGIRAATTNRIHEPRRPAGRARAR